MSGHPASKGPPTSKDPTSMASPRPGKQLPTEIISLILSYLQQDGDYKSLAAVARTRRSFYDLAIPMIYESVVVNERNSSMLDYGYSPTPSQLSEGKLTFTSYVDAVLWILERELMRPGAKREQTPTRKNSAAVLTRKITFDSPPTGFMVGLFRNVEIVAITSRCLDRIMGVHGADTDFEMLGACISIIGSMRSGSTPLHLVLHAAHRVDNRFCHLLGEIGTMFHPMTFEFRDMPIAADNQWDLLIALRLRAVVHCLPDHPLDHGDTARSLASLLESCFSNMTLQDTGVIYLCDIPQLVLTPEELTNAKSAGNANDVARLKMINTTASKGATTSVVISGKWDQFAPKVHYVEFGFRGSLAEAETVFRERSVPVSSYCKVRIAEADGRQAEARRSFSTQYVVM
jgi:hypothetical protein